MRPLLVVIDFIGCRAVTVSKPQTRTDNDLVALVPVSSSASKVRDD